MFHSVSSTAVTRDTILFVKANERCDCFYLHDHAAVRDRVFSKKNEKKNRLPNNKLFMHLVEGVTPVIHGNSRCVSTKPT